jgi:hypothetical protein
LKQVLFICLLLFIVSVNISAQTKVKKSTLEIFENSISGEFEKLFFLPGVERSEKFIFCVNGYHSWADRGIFINKDQITKFVVSVLRKTAEKLQLKFSIVKFSDDFDSDSSYNKFWVTIDTIKTTYPKFIKNKFLGEKTIQRKLMADLDVQISSSRQDKKRNEKIHIDYTDEIELDNYETYEADEYNFTKAVPPEVSSFESVIFPVILAVVSAATTVLFFTIRTK